MSADRFCRYCGKPLQRHADEGPNRWRQRRYCGRLCAGSAATRQNYFNRSPRASVAWDARDQVDGDLINLKRLGEEESP